MVKSIDGPEVDAQRMLRATPQQGRTGIIGGARKRVVTSVNVNVGERGRS